MGILKKLNIDYIPRYTYEDYSHWEGRWELIDGVAYAMSPQPRIAHQRISNNIAAQLKESLEGCNRCFAVVSVDWKISEDTVVQPDNLVVCGEDEGLYLTKPPEIIFEILSPSTAFKDKNIKYKIYESEGVKYYVIVDIDAKVAEVFELINGSYQKLKDAQDVIITFDVNECKIDFDFAMIW
jgi:Uma2 family endonuclease